MKLPLVFASGLGLGILFGWVGGSHSTSSAPASTPATAQAEAKSARSTAAPAEASSAPETRPERAARPPKPDKSDKPIVRTFSSTDGEQTPEMKEIMEKMKKAQEEKRARKIDERLAALKSRLGLTDEQAAKVKAILQKADEDGGDATDLLSGGKAIDVNKLLNGESKGDREALDAKLAEVLTPEQQDKFQAFQQDQKENRIEIATNREMTRLQQSLTLTPDQKDRAYQALGELAQREENQPATSGIDPQAMMAKQQARRDALRPILTPEQMKAYESTPMQSSFEGGGISIQLNNVSEAISK